MTMQKTLYVCYQNKLVGTLALQGKVPFHFAYAPQWLDAPDAFAISRSLPLQRDPFSYEATLAFFDNLLPEERTRHTIERTLQVSKSNTFALLRELGGECAGALSIVTAPNCHTAPSEAPGYEEVQHKQLSALLELIPQRPLLAGEDGMRLSLAGAQPKLPILYAEGRCYLARNNAPSSHILKPPIADLAESAENEAFCMFLARAVGIDAPFAKLIHTRPRAYLVERYDRRYSPSGIERIHQEDFCQAMGIPSAAKYEREGGPCLHDCFTLLDECRNPQEDKAKLLALVVYNYLIGNADAHAKNLSLLYDDGQKPRLAPAYDLLCTRVYDGLATNMAMKIGGSYDPDFIDKKRWLRLASLAALTDDEGLSRVEQHTNRLLANASIAADVFCETYGESPIVRRIVRLALQRCNTTLERLQR